MSYRQSNAATAASNSTKILDRFLCMQDVNFQPPTEAPAPETPPPAYDEEAAPAPDAATQPATAFPSPGQPTDVDTVLPPESETFNPFKVPEGLTMDAPHLLGILGYGGHPCASASRRVGAPAGRPAGSVARKPRTVTASRHLCSPYFIYFAMVRVNTLP